MTEQFKENKETQLPKRVFIEVGTNAIPVPSLGRRAFEENEVYIGIDINKKELKRIKDYPGLKNKNFYFINADAIELPLKKESADEIFFGNVFGDPNIEFEDKERFMQEAIRALKEEGHIIIKETNTPTSLRYLRSLLKRHDLRVEKGFTPKDPQWKESIRPYQGGLVEKLVTEDSYLVFLKPYKDKK